MTRNKRGRGSIFPRGATGPNRGQVQEAASMPPVRPRGHLTRLEAHLRRQAFDIISQAKACSRREKSRRAGGDGHPQRIVDWAVLR